MIVISHALLFVAVARAVGVSVSAGGGSLSEIKPYEPLIHSLLVAVARAGRCQCVSWKVLVQYIVMNYVDLRDSRCRLFRIVALPPRRRRPVVRMSRC